MSPNARRRYKRRMIQVGRNRSSVYARWRRLGFSSGLEWLTQFARQGARPMTFAEGPILIPFHESRTETHPWVAIAKSGPLFEDKQA